VRPPWRARSSDQRRAQRIGLCLPQRLLTEYSILKLSCRSDGSACTVSPRPGAKNIRRLNWLRSTFGRSAVGSIAGLTARTDVAGEDKGKRGVLRTRRRKSEPGSKKRSPSVYLDRGLYPRERRNAEHSARRSQRFRGPAGRELPAAACLIGAVVGRRAVRF
jgi:hypothetical protein